MTTNYWWRAEAANPFLLLFMTTDMRVLISWPQVQKYCLLCMPRKVVDLGGPAQARGTQNYVKKTWGSTFPFDGYIHTNEGPAMTPFYRFTLSSPSPMPTMARIISLPRRQDKNYGFGAT